MFKTRSLSAKLTMMITAVTAAGIAAGFLAVTLIDARNFRGELEADARLAARLAAEYCVAPLAFGYHEEAGQMLGKLAIFDDIAYAAVYDENGALFAHYLRSGKAPPQTLGALSTAPVGSFETVEQMTYNGKRYGTARLAVSTGRLRHRIAGRIALLGALAAIMGVAAFLLAGYAQRAVSRPVLDLAGLMKAVALRGDYSLRSGIRRDDEIGTLAAGFDSMLGALEARGRERDEAEEALRQAHAELETRVKERTAELKLANNELEAFTYSASHDLRAPLRRIDGFSSLLEEDCGGQMPEEGRQHISRIRAGCRQMAEVIDSLLKLSRVMRQVAEFKALDLSTMAADIFAGLKETEPLRKIEFSAQPGLLAEGDRVLIGEVLENLLSNAWKFTRYSPSPRVEFGAEQRGGELTYFVRDNGKGFDMQYAGKLFHPFQRLHSPTEFPGTGIGLTTVQRIIERHGGRIWAEAEEDKGAVFYFTLRNGHAAGEAEDGKNETAAAQPKGRRHD